jgi:DMSO/TMAO reductase YedYZ molybdopterin-dependent catalytic subunit
MHGHGAKQSLCRRNFLRTASLVAAGLGAGRGVADETITLPFENGARPLVKYPQKRPLIRLTTRPPQLETPFAVFNEDVLTPNDAFFVRYHLTNSPPPVEVLKPEIFRLSVGGLVSRPLELSLVELTTVRTGGSSGRESMLWQ